MAKIKLSSIGITNISGKAGGTIYANNKGGAYMKNFAVPSNPRSTDQQARRASFTQITQAWRGLTQGQRNAWEGAAKDFPRRNHFGDVYFLSGNSLFQSMNSNLNTLGEAINEEAPIKVDLNNFNNLKNTVQYNATGEQYIMYLSVDLDSPTETNTKYALFVSPPLSPGITNAKKRMRFLSVLEASDLSSNFNYHTAYAAKYGEPTIGSKIFIELKAIGVEHGQIGSDQSESDIVDIIS